MRSTTSPTSKTTSKKSTKKTPKKSTKKTPTVKPVLYYQYNQKSGAFGKLLYFAAAAPTRREAAAYLQALYALFFIAPSVRLTDYSERALERVYRDISISEANGRKGNRDFAELLFVHKTIIQSVVEPSEVNSDVDDDDTFSFPAFSL